MKIHGRIFPVVLFIMCLLATSLGYANGMRLWNLKDVDVINVIHQVSKETGKNFIVDPRVKGKVTLISGHPISPDELYQTFLAILSVHGFVAVSNNNATKIVPEQDITGDSQTSLGKIFLKEEVVAKVMHVHYVSSQELVKSLKPLVPKYSYIDAYPPTNDIIISARKSNIDTIHELVTAIDKPTNDETEIIPLRNASATDVVQTLDGLLNNSARKLNPIFLSADDRTNSVLISGDRERRLKVRALISQLDVKTSQDGGNTDVIYLKFIRAQDLAPIVANLIANYQQKTPGQGVNSQPSKRSSARGRAPNQNSLSGMNTTQNNATNASNSSSSYMNTSMSSFSGDDVQKSGSIGTAVQWEETTNALIVSAPPTLMRTIKSVISKLDVRREQVLVEAVIAELTVSRARELGVEWNAGNDVRFATRFPSPTLTSLSKTTLASIADAAAVNAGAVPFGSGLTFGIFHGGNLKFLIRALAEDTSSNILSTPNLVTLDNEPAQIKVGQKVTFATGETRNDVSSNGTPYQSFDREEVGLSLTIRPQITQSGAIKLEIEHLLSNVIPNSQGVGNNPTTSERGIHTNVLVDNGEVLVLGGLMQDEWTEVNSKVPILGDIPGLKYFFSSKSRSLVKKNLMIFLRPIVMRTPEDNVRISGGKYNYMLQRQLDAKRDIVEPYSEEPLTLPQLGGQRKLPLPFAGG